MYAEPQKLHIIEPLLNVEDADILSELEMVLAKNQPKANSSKSFKSITGRLSLEETNALERIIEEGCEQINEDDWK